MRKVIAKAFAYITHDHRLLVFEHTDAPEAGIQVPAGTIEPGETPAEGALREAHEETGLTQLDLAHYLGYQTWRMKDVGKAEIHMRYFYHVRCTQPDPPQRWQHADRLPSAGSERAVPFTLYWVALPDGVPPLMAGHGAFIGMLLRKMGVVAP